MSKNTAGISGFFSPGENPEESFEPEISLMYRNEDGPFELYECAGRGRKTVLKTIRLQDRDNPLYNEMLRKEYEIGRSLNHPNIREYYSMREFPGLGMCVEMEWIDARTLEEVLEHCHHDSRYCDAVASQLLDAVRILHLKQVVHRDLKPSNILVTRKGNNVKVIDFSLSDTDSHLILKGNAGTLMYASPEQISCSESDYLSDIYSLGVILSRMSSRRRYRKVAGKCMRTDTKERFASVAELKEELFRPSRMPWFAASVLIAIIVLSAFILVRSSDAQPVTTESTQNAAPGTPASLELPETEKGSSERAAGSEFEESAKHSVPEANETEEVVDSQDIDNLFREATDLFL